MTTEDRVQVGHEFFWAIRRGQIDMVRDMCSRFPWLPAADRPMGEEPWISVAVTKGNRDMVEALLDLGCNIDALRLPEEESALGTAIGCEHEEVVRLLLKRGANPNLSRCLIAALNVESADLRAMFVRLLVESRADVNQLFPLYGDRTRLFTALDWAAGDVEMARFLRGHGARTASELLADRTAS